MLNIFKIKKAIAYLITAMVPLVFYTIGLLLGNGNIFIAYFLAMFSVVVIWFVYNQLLIHPFTKTIEGTAMSAITLDSTGILQPFNVELYDSKYIRGMDEYEKIKDIFDRECVSVMKPEKFGMYKKLKNGGLLLFLPEQDVTAAKFGFLSYVTFLWNKQLNSFLTKDFLSTQEHMIFSEHNIRFLNAVSEDTHAQIRDFARHAIDVGLRPIKKLFDSPMFTYIMVALIIILAIVFAPTIIKFMSSLMSSFAGALPKR